MNKKPQELPRTARKLRSGMKPGSTPRRPQPESMTGKDSEKVEDEDGEVVKENGDKPQLLEDEVQRKQRKSPATEENASKDDGDHV